MKAIIAASGSGGHLFPAIYIAKALKAISPDIEIVFIGSGRPLEEKILGSEGSKVLTLPVQGIKNKGMRGLLSFVFSLPKAFLEIRKIFKTHSPRIVIGVGGYVTFFPVVYATLRGIPSWIHEAELKPGLANYVLSFFATKISVAFKDAEMPNARKVVFTGHPVRMGLEIARSEMPLSESPRNVLVLGGSQGAQALDRALPELGRFILENQIQVVHQCRKDNVESVKSAYFGAGVQAEVVPFIDDMAGAYKWADILVSRSGAGSVMEIGIVNKPTIFVPFPYSQGDHQVANARILVDAGKALMCQEGEGFVTRLKESFQALLSIDTYNQMKLRSFEGRSLDAANKIAQGCLDLIR